MSNYCFYVDGDDLGIVAENTSGSYGANNTSATLKLFGTFQQDDLSSDSDTPNLINPRYHIAIAYKAMAELDPKNYMKWEHKYNQIVKSIRINHNRLDTKRTQRQYFF